MAGTAKAQRKKAAKGSEVPSQEPEHGIVEPDGQLEGEVDVVLATSRALVAIAARSLAPVDDVVTLAQWRVLVVVNEYGSASLNEVAGSLGVHASTATRICDRLTAAGLLSRREDATDRRYLALTLTRKGQRLVDRVTQHRRSEIAAVLAALPPTRRKRVAAAFADFAAAAGAPDTDLVWSAITGEG